MERCSNNRTYTQTRQRPININEKTTKIQAWIDTERFRQ